MTKQPHPIDVHVGNRVRLRRMVTGISQEKLGAQLGLTFQQVQKYEKGANRISASKLFEISKVLQTPVAFFFSELAGEPSGMQGMAEAGAEEFTYDFMNSPESIQLNNSFQEITDPATRRRIVDLVKALADKDSE